MGDRTLGPSATSHWQTLPFEKLSPDKFEELCLGLLSREGYDRVRHVGATGQDGGIDLVTEKDCERGAA